MISLKERTAAILSKYDNIDEDNIEDVYVLGVFLGLSEQLVRILMRNTGNIPKAYKRENFYYEIVVTYIDLYREVLIHPIIPQNLPELEYDIAYFATVKFFNEDYNIIDHLPASCANQNKGWIRAMRQGIKIFGIENCALLSALERVISSIWEEPIFFDLDKNYQPEIF